MSLIKIKTTGLKTFWDVVAEKLNITILKDRLPKNESWRSVGLTGQPAFGDGWGNPYSGTGWPSTLMTTNFPVQFRKDSIGMIHLRGVLDVSSAEEPTPIFTLPSGYRPSKDTCFICPAQPSAGQTNSIVLVKTNGQVWLQFDGGGAYPFELSGIHFFTD